MTALAADPTIRRQVIAAARELLGRDPSLPVAVIAAAAGVSRATFYRHFGSRGALLAEVEHEPRPDARSRILEAAQEILIRDSLDGLSMDELARAAAVSRGTLYRLFPGKAALLRGLIEAYSPFEPMHRLLERHRGDPPSVVLPLVARTVVDAVVRRRGLVRVIFHEVTSGKLTAVAGVEPVVRRAIGELSGYMAEQMAAGRVRQMHPLLAVQAFMGPIYFHVMSRPVAERIVPLEPDVREAVDQLVSAVRAGLERQP